MIGRKLCSTTQLRRVHAIDHNKGSVEHRNGPIDDACKCYCRRQEAVRETVGEKSTSSEPVFVALARVPAARGK